MVQGGAQIRNDGSADGQLTVQLISSLQLVFARVEEILVDGNQNPVGAVLSGRGAKNDNGRETSLDFTFTVRRLANGGCCSVQILAPQIHASGGIRFEGPGELRFASR